MAVENITLNIIPTGDTPSIHVAQFDVDRPFTVTLKEGTDDFTPTDYTIELQVRKVDATIVTVLPVQTSGNVVTFNTTEQMTACSGTNLAELQLTKDSQTFATLHFYLVVQRDILAGGVTSESDIYNLTEQIAEIVPGVIGDDYYTKEEVDEIIEDIPTFDPTNYYDKSETDALLSDKANTSELSAVAFSGDYDDLENKPLIPDVSNYYTKTEVDTKITDLYQIKTVSGSIVHITDGGNAIPVKSLVSQIVAVESGNGQPKSPTNPYTISGFSQGVITVTDNDQITNTYTFTFGQTVYGGHFDNKGNLVVTHKILNFDYQSNWKFENLLGGNFYVACGSDVKESQFGDDLLCNCSPSSSILAVTSNTCLISIAKNFNFTWGVTLGVTNVDDFKTYLQTNNLVIKVKCLLANPITLAITSQDIPTLLECNIFSNCGDVEVKYFTSKSDGIAELIKAFI